MVSVLQALYVLTVVVFLAAAIQYGRGRRSSALHLLWLGILSAGLAVLLYWSLRPAG